MWDILHSLSVLWHCWFGIRKCVRTVKCPFQQLSEISWEGPWRNLPGSPGMWKYGQADGVLGWLSELHSRGGGFDWQNTAAWCFWASCLHSYSPVNRWDSLVPVISRWYCAAGKVAVVLTLHCITDFSSLTINSYLHLLDQERGKGDVHSVCAPVWSRASFVFEQKSREADVQCCMVWCASAARS